MTEIKEIEQAKALLKKASEEITAKTQEIEKLAQEMSAKDKLISDLTAKHEKLLKDFEAVSKELKHIKQEAIDAEEKFGILETSKEQRLAELRQLDDTGGFDLYAKQTKKMLELHNSIGDRKSLINNSNQTTDRKQEIAAALGMKI